MIDRKTIRTKIHPDSHILIIILLLVSFGISLNVLFSEILQSYQQYHFQKELLVRKTINERYVIYNSHSGFNNQRMALENAIIISFMLNAT
jgi:hypothetical protein